MCGFKVQTTSRCIEAELPEKGILLLANFDVMSFIKSHLKAAREHIGKKDYLTAKKEAIQVLDFEPDNYNALAACDFYFLYSRWHVR